MAVVTKFASSPDCSLLPLTSEFVNVGTNASRRERALRKEIARQIGNTETEQKRIVGETGAELVSHHHFADKPGNTTDRNGDRDDSRRAHDLRIRRWHCFDGCLGGRRSPLAES